MTANELFLTERVKELERELAHYQRISSLRTKTFESGQIELNVMQEYIRLSLDASLELQDNPMDYSLIATFNNPNQVAMYSTITKPLIEDHLTTYDKLVKKLTEVLVVECLKRNRIR